MTTATPADDAVGGFRRSLASARWALRVAWEANPRLLVGVALVTLVRAVIPAGLAITARGLVNTAVATLGGTGEIGALLPWLLAGFALTVADGVGQLAGTLGQQTLRGELNYRVTLDVLRHASRLEIAHYDDPRFHDGLQRATQQPAEHVSRFVGEALNAAASVLQIATLLGVLVYIEPLVLLVAFVLAVPYLRFQWRLSLRQYAVEHARTTARCWSSYFVSLVTGRGSVAEVRTLGLAPVLIDRFRAVMREFRDQDRQWYRRDFAGSALFVVLTTAAVYAIFVRAAARVLQGTLSVGDLAVFGGATNRLRATIQFLVQSVSTAMQQTLHIADVRQFFAMPPGLASARGTREPGRRAEIELRDVSFTYPGAAEAAIDAVSLSIRPGETVALVGENGAGKTTLVKLIAGLYEPDTGEIRFDGVDLRELSPERLWQRIAFVFQSFGRYEASAGENIAYGDWEKLLRDPDATRRAAVGAGVDPLIRSLPRGYDTRIGRLFGEHDLSGGQWQSLAVARAFARDAALLILDEPTANLDARAEADLFRHFHALAKGRTTIIVSHRFSTVRVADRILVMETGRIAESGSHDELIARDGGYAQLYALHAQRIGAVPR